MVTLMLKNCDFKTENAFSVEMINFSLQIGIRAAFFFTFALTKELSLKLKITFLPQLLLRTWLSHFRCETSEMAIEFPLRMLLGIFRLRGEL